MKISAASYSFGPHRRQVYCFAAEHYGPSSSSEPSAQMRSGFHCGYVNGKRVPGTMRAANRIKSSRAFSNRGRDVVGPQLLRVA